MHDRASRELARQWDAQDALARFRKQFYRPTSQIYLDAHSLGMCSQEAERSLLRALGAWKTKASEAWNGGPADWTSMAQEVAARVARFVGAAPDEVAIGHSPAVNLHQLLATIYWRPSRRSHLLIDGFCSASTRAVLQSHLELRGLDGQSELLVLPPNDARLLDEAEIETAMANPALRLAVLPSVVGATGQLLNLPRICRAAREHGVILGLDLSHSLGVMPHALDEWGVDFAFWAHSYFAQGGPGAAGGLFLHRRHFGERGAAEPGLAGGENASDEGECAWFDGDPKNEGAAPLRIGPPSVFSLAPLEGALRHLEEAGLARLRAKSLDLTQFLRFSIEGEIPTLDIVTPKEAEGRGGHLALWHPAAGEICEALRQNGVSVNFRRPDTICLAPTPLHNSFVECWDAVQILRRVIEAKVEASLAPAAELVS